MDPELWGSLQHIHSTDLPDELLKIIYTKLPIQDFFRLRLVCKDWNHAATDRAFLERTCTTPIAKPHFVVMHPRGPVHGLLYRDAVSQGWNWTRLPFEAHNCGIAEEKGLILSFNRKELRGVHTLEVFNVHTRVRHVLPPISVDAVIRDAGGITCFPGLIALRVDTKSSVTSNYAFQVVITNFGVSTHIYDSRTNSWSLKCTERVPLECGFPFGVSTSAECNGFLYLVSQITPLNLLTYHVERDVWGTLEPSPGSFDVDQLREVVAPIGAWQSRLFFVTVEIRNRSVSIWELVDHSGAEWTDLDYRRMPKELLSYLCAFGDDDSEGDRREHHDLRSSFCYEYVLVYDWDLQKGFAKRFVMCDMDAEAWGIVDAPVPLISRQPIFNEMLRNERWWRPAAP